MDYSTYICEKCKKVYKAKGKNARVKCPNCKDVPLTDMCIDFDQWRSFGKEQKAFTINSFFNESVNDLFFSPMSFGSMVSNLKSKSDDDLLKLLVESREEIFSFYYDIDETTAGSTLAVVGLEMVCDGLTELPDKKRNMLYDELYKDTSLDIDQFETLLMSYSPDEFNQLYAITHMFESDEVAKSIFNYLLAAACIVGASEKGMSNVKELFTLWFEPYNPNFSRRSDSQVTSDPTGDEKQGVRESKADTPNEQEKKIPEPNDSASTYEKTSQENAIFIYVCRKCRKVFKIKGGNKKIKCKSCSSLLDFINVTGEEWDTYDKPKKSAVIKGETIKEPHTQKDEEYVFEYEKIKDNSSIIKGHMVVTDEDGNEYQEDLFGNRLDEIGKYECVVNFYSELAPIVGIGQFLNNMREKGEKLCWKSIKNKIEIINLPVTIIVTMSSDNVVEIKKCGRLTSGSGKVISERKISLQELIQTDLEKVDLAKEYDLAAAAVSVSFLPEFKKNGVIDNLNEYSNRGAGVHLAIKDNKINITVVMRNTRPDLECIDPIFGKIKARPYRDEGIIKSILSDMSLDKIVKYAEDGNPESMEKVANAYFNGDGVSRDFAKAAYWYEKLAMTEDPTGQYNIGLMYAKGCGVTRDLKKAVFWMKKSSEAGDEDAAGMVDSLVSLRDNYDKASRGDAQAQADLAEAFMKLGGSVEQMGEGDDYRESFKWAEKSASQGNGKGIWILALAYAHGRGTNVDKKKALELYKQGAELGNPSCQHNLGCQYLSGQLVPKDDNKGFEWIRKAAIQGHGLAMRDLGKCFQFATGTPGNMKTAIQWYEKALEVIDDPELAQKVEHFKALESIDPDFGKDYPQSESKNNGGISDATEIIRDGLRRQGKNYDDDSIANLSVEDAYDALFSGDETGSITGSSKTAYDSREEVDNYIRTKIKEIRKEKDAADRRFDEGIDILRNPGVTMDYDNFIDVSTRLFKMSDATCRSLYNTLQNLIQELNDYCKILLKHNPSDSVKREVYELIKEMNENSEITNNFKIEFNDMNIDNPCQKEFEPSIQTKQIERFWKAECDRSTADSSSNTTTTGSNTGKSSFFDTMNNRSAVELDERDSEIMDVLNASAEPLTISDIHKRTGEKYSFQVITARLKRLQNEDMVVSQMEGRFKKYSAK